MELKTLLTTSLRLSVPCSEMIMDFLISAMKAHAETIIRPRSCLITDAKRRFLIEHKRTSLNLLFI